MASEFGRLIASRIIEGGPFPSRCVPMVSVEMVILRIVAMCVTPLAGLRRIMALWPPPAERRTRLGPLRGAKLPWVSPSLLVGHPYPRLPRLGATLPKDRALNLG